MEIPHTSMMTWYMLWSLGGHAEHGYNACYIL
jgi:hypothetical protein